MSWLKDARYGIAEITAAENPTLISFIEGAGPHPAGKVGIYGLILPEQPDDAISLNVYVLTEVPVTVLGVQFRIRARTDGRLDEIEDAVSNSWTDRWGGNLREIPLVAGAWASGASLGQDQNGRIERSINFAMTVQRPLTHRTT